MKATLTLLILLVFSGISFGQTAPVKITEPIKYNDYIVDEQNEIGAALLDLMDVISDDNSTYSEAEAYLMILTSTIDSSIIDVKNLEQLKKDFGLKKAALDLFGFYKQIMNNQYVEMLEILYSDSPDSDRLNEITTEVSELEKGYDAAFQKAQQDFATANGFTLTPNSMQDDIDGSGQ